MGDKIALVAFVNALRANDVFLHAPQTLHVLGESLNPDRHGIILANEDSWWKKKRVN